METLCANMLSETEQLRDISSIGLKTVISELPLGSNTLAANVCKKITGRLSSAIEKVWFAYFIYLQFHTNTCTHKHADNK